MSLFGARSLARLAPCALLVLAGAGAAAQEAAPLPDRDVFLREVRKRLQSDRLLVSQYSYVETRRELKISRLGKVSTGPEEIYEVYPSVDPEHTYRRLVEVDGVRVPPEELEEQDRKHREDQRKRALQLEREGLSEREKRLREEAEAREREREAIEDLIRIYDFQIEGRDRVDGHRTIVLTFTPRPDSRPRTDEGKLFAKAKGRAWVSEAEHEIVRVEAETIDDITVGWGLIGRLHAGSTARFERRKVNGEIWLPARREFAGSGRTLLFRKFDVETVSEFSQYRKQGEDSQPMER